MPTVTRIEPTIDFRTHAPIQTFKKRKTCGYARVSTDSAEQATSYDAQVDYYKKYIQSNPSWEYVGMYADDGITGTSTKRRNGFKDMIQDALDHKIDLILAKSISRFARNTVDSLVNIRKLKENGVEVYFEKENIWTFDEKGEVLLTIMASLAQEESRSISENVTWGIRKRFSDGKYSLGYKQFLGYDKGPDGGLVVNKEQAKIVRMIYRWFLEGMTARLICNELDSLNIPTPAGKSKWKAATVMSILTNEKYKGAALLQKTYTTDFLTKKTKPNEGELPKYYIEDAHEAIINPNDWNLVQEEVERRRQIGKGYSANSYLASRLICEDCGGFFGAKVWHSNDPYRKVIYRCNNKYSGEKKCHTPHITEEELKERFLQAYNEYMLDRDTIITDAEAMRDFLSDTATLEEQLKQKKAEQDEKGELYKALITKSPTLVDNESFCKQEDRIYKEYVALGKEVDALSGKLTKIRNRKAKLDNYINDLRQKPLILDEWNSMIWISTIKHCVVRKDGNITFVFKDGKEINV